MRRRATSLKIWAAILRIRRRPRNGFQFFLTVVCCIDSSTKFPAFNLPQTIVKLPPENQE